MVEKKKAKKVVKKKEVVEEKRPAFETRSDIKKMHLYIVIVPKGQGDNIIKILKANKSSAQFIQIGEGTANSTIRDILDIEDTSKEIIYSFVREDVFEDLQKEIDVYFIASKRNRGIAFSIPLTSIVGVKMYKFLTQTVRG